MTTTKLEKKCNEYIRNRLRAPPIPLVKKWGRQLKMKSADIDKISGEIARRVSRRAPKEFKTKTTS